jgi:hypothetical protein
MGYCSGTVATTVTLVVSQWHSMHTLPRAPTVSTKPCSLATRAYSHSSSSLSRNSTITTGLTTISDGALNQTTGINQRRDEGPDSGEQLRRVGTYSNDCDAWLGETSALTRWVDSRPTSRQRLPPWGRLPWRSPPAIRGNERRGDF